MMCGFVAGYAMFQAQNIWNGPIIIVEDPSNGGSSPEVAQIAGVARNIISLTLNGRQIFTDKNGNFAGKLLLSEGYNVVKITAQDKFGRSVDKTVELVYKDTGSGHTLTVNDQEHGKAI